MVGEGFGFEAVRYISLIGRKLVLISAPLEFLCSSIHWTQLEPLFAGGQLGSVSEMRPSGRGS